MSIFNVRALAGLRTGNAAVRGGAKLVADAACPVCGEGVGLVVATRDRRRRPLKTVACLRCGLMRVDPLPAADELVRFYESEYRHSYKGVRRPKLKHVYRSGRLATERLRRLACYLSPGAMVLDVGCGSGEWLYILRAAGCSAVGIELDQQYAEFGRQEYGVDIRTGSICTSELPGRHFHLITMFHVLEHLPNPVQSLERLRCCALDGGLLALEVPNVNCVHQHPAKRFHYAHVVGFTPESFALAIRMGGWEMVELSLDRHQRNLFAVARKRPDGALDAAGHQPDANVPHPPPIISSVASTLKYYLRPSTYLRWLARMRQFTGEFRVLVTRRTPRELLRELAASAAGQPVR